jgi:hypothetical protein
MIAVTGNTFPVKDQIKALGGRWNADLKAWMVPDAKAAEAQKLIAGAPKDSAPKAARQIIAGLLADTKTGTVDLRSAAARKVASTPAPGRCIDCGAHSGKYRRCYDCAQEQN